MNKIAFALISLSLVAGTANAAAGAGGSRGGVYPLPYASAPAVAKASEAVSAEKANMPASVDKNIPSTFYRTNGGNGGAH
ncbi:hypothetical protein [Caballeronia sp. BCC1704]|uniref:hypothetical protein n=1 Tax=Caballeronia sp. BCC1704 TaxID=2676300 RepID=UPI00158E35C9|nr:hypothetical protein [Caballeronia sp. BCC1704]